MRPSTLGVLALLLCGITALASAVTLTVTHWPSALQRGSVPTASAPLTVSSTGKGEGTSLTVAAIPAPRPDKIFIPDLRVTAQVIPEGVNPGGALDIPDDPATVGWWSGGAAPTDTAGSVVLAGHVDSVTHGRGAFFRLRELRPRNPVIITAGTRTLLYMVTGVRDYPKQALPAQVFSQAVAGRLVLVTCGGTFDTITHHYSDNVVVYAIPANP